LSFDVACLAFEKGFLGGLEEKHKKQILLDTWQYMNLGQRLTKMLIIFFF
jgi:hypothetical protein